METKNHEMHQALCVPQHQQRLNVMFHGVMAFREVGDSYEVLIPKPGQMNHIARYGNPYPDPNCLRPFKDSHYRLEGVCDCLSRSPQPTGKDGLLLANTLLDVQHDNIEVTIVVPKPDLIRGYRPVEVRGIDLAQGDNTHRALHCPPDVIHEVVVFSYFIFSDPVLCSSNDPFDVPYHSTEKFGSFWNLCIYSQSPQSDFQDHSDLFNGMFLVKRPDGRTDPLRLHISVRGEGPERLADDPPLRTADRVGIRYLELLSLAELNNCENNKLIKGLIGDEEGSIGLLTADPSSCSSGHAADTPGS
jgi:hypothetical protein